ncbi:hypothetical protein [Paenibacillus typhae]|uniref:hypothetical protein n=1 Tax=Paenibacillus typhae TaxID=1174501 RepID=UPI001C8F0F7C|nr:hypothetical protein [Paenibacillus typhae]MBY0013912.1 hypothetical protein [Paenibacillus typhae]
MRDKQEDKVPLQEWTQSRESWPLLEEYLQLRSGLPGPRANLELAARFARGYARAEITDTAWILLTVWAEDPGEYLPFCAVQACAAHYAFTDSLRRGWIKQMLKRAMNDARWRVREAAAIGLQYVGEYNFPELRELLEQRAFVAGLAHPPMLKSREQAQYSLGLAAEITDGILNGRSAGYDSEQFRVLSKGLEYSLSLFVAAEPEAGFALLGRLAASGDERMVRIVKSNLSKARLSKKYPGQVEELLAGLTSA